MSPETCSQHQNAISSKRWDLKTLGHLAACSSCRSYAFGIARIERLTRQSGLSAPPPLAALPDLYPDESSVPQKRLSPVSPVVGIATLALVGGAGVFAYISYVPSTSAPIVIPRKGSTPRPNTWHFVGWRKVGDKKLPWEIWGQRKPFFYRERLGDYNEIIENNYSLRYVPPIRPDKPAVVLIRSWSSANQNQPSQQPLTSGAISLIDGMDKRSTFQRFQTVREEKETITLASAFTPLPNAAYVGNYAGGIEEKNTITLNKATKLPERLRLEWKGNANLYNPNTPKPTRNAENPNTVREMAELTMSYNIAIPENVRTIDPPSGTAIVDTRYATRFLTSEQDKNGIGTVLDVKATGRDPEGNIRLSLNLWAGGKNLRDLPANASLSGSILFLSPSSNLPTYLFQDDLGMMYVPLAQDFLWFNNPEATIIPLEPVTRKTAQSRHLIVNSQFQLIWNDTPPDQTNGVVFGWSASQLTFALPLPAVGSAPAYSEDSLKRLPGNQAFSYPLLAALTRMRVYIRSLSYAFSGPPQAKVVSPERKQAIQRCHYWRSEALRALSRSDIAPGQKQDIRRECDGIKRQLDSFVIRPQRGNTGR